MALLAGVASTEGEGGCPRPGGVPRTGLAPWRRRKCRFAGMGRERSRWWDVVRVDPGTGFPIARRSGDSLSISLISWRVYERCLISFGLTYFCILDQPIDVG